MEIFVIGHYLVGHYSPGCYYHSHSMAHDGFELVFHCYYLSQPVSLLQTKLLIRRFVGKSSNGTSQVKFNYLLIPVTGIFHTVFEIKFVISAFFFFWYSTNVQALFSNSIHWIMAQYFELLIHTVFFVAYYFFCTKYFALQFDARVAIKYSSHLRITYLTDEKVVCTFCFLLFSLANITPNEWVYYDVKRRTLPLNMDFAECVAVSLSPFPSRSLSFA